MQHPRPALFDPKGPARSAALPQRSLLTPRQLWGAGQPDGQATPPAGQNTDHPIRELSNSSAAIPAYELPAVFNSGDHTQTVN